MQVQRGDLDMAFTDGDIEISPEEQSVDITTPRRN